MRLLKLLIVLTFVAGVAVCAWNYELRTRDRELALPILSDYADGIGSIQPPFAFGSEYYVTFRNRPLSRKDIDRVILAVQTLAVRNHIGLSFDEVSLLPEDREYLQDRLPEIGIDIRAH